jgi:hypothetical protein
MIYFIENTETKHIKIGFSTDVRRRLIDLQISSPHELKILTICEGDDKLEKELHKRFGEHHFRGEWFLPNKELKEYIKSFPEYRHSKKELFGLRKLRSEKKISMEELGKKMKISKQGVKDAEDRYENGNITINSLKKYLDALGYEYTIVFNPK